MTKQEAAAALRQYAVLLELLGQEAFRSRAFENAARTLETQTETLEDLIASGRLAAIKGIGKGVAAAIVELHASGTFADLDTAQEQVPPGVLDLLRIDGLGPKRARALWIEARVASLAALERELAAGSIEKLPGFGAKTAAKFRAGLEFLNQTAGRHLRHHAFRQADALRYRLEPIHGIEEILFCGSLRRNLETVGDLDVLLVAAPDRIANVREQIQSLTDIHWNETGPLLRGTTAHGFEIELSIVTPNEAARHKVLATGSREHVARLTELAAAKGIDLHGPGHDFESEAAVYAAVGLTYVPPPLRESTTHLRPAGESYSRPVSADDIRGILHVHTTASDGHHTLRELAAAMMERGYEYIGIADHSQAAAYAHGLTPDRVREQWREIDALNRELSPFHILKGTEADILADGTPDFDEELLAGFDFVIASIHSGFNMTEAEATKRLCRAIENPHVDILGHMTGRLLLERNGYPVDHETVIHCAAEHGKAIELNCNPHRLDLDWRWLSRCAELGVPVPLSPDAHAVEGLWDLRWGLELAAKGPLVAMDCPNTWTSETLIHWCQTRRRSL